MSSSQQQQRFYGKKKITISKAKIQIRYWENTEILEDIQVTSMTMD